MKGWVHSMISISGNGSKKDSLMAPYFDDDTKNLINSANDTGKNSFE
ncbi:hypothetical protein A9A89_2142 [Bifidobacterium psychraerophilum DSM 22366]|uniref:Uncharacterized protein n=1 Tax=Bifidobacterium psychraerophilum TaxID=218140 RepID=A0A087CE17_9BIFI|nr:hypothetical protein BPSY_1926 [Bifidobacterium psychraerophilum]PKA95862.1 hypothetical protein A9A89_2142 [Bifidobacterium psychraerophilum DSM 22366]